MAKIEEKKKHSWTKDQDEVLIYLKQHQKVNKRTDISKKLSQNHNIHGRKDKNCRDRYENFLKTNKKQRNWTVQKQRNLINLFLIHGNKWSQLAEKYENINGAFVKNKFYSRLRKGMRNINHLIQENHRQVWKKFDFDIIFKLVTCSTNKFDLPSRSAIGRKMQVQISFVQEIIEKLFRLSWISNISSKKKSNKQRLSLLNCFNIEALIDQINFIDENLQKKRSNRIILKKQTKIIEPQNIIDIGKTSSMKKEQFQEDHQYNSIQTRKKNTNSAPSKRRQIQIISTNSFQLRSVNPKIFLQQLSKLQRNSREEEILAAQPIKIQQEPITKHFPLEFATIYKEYIDQQSRLKKQQSGQKNEKFY